MIPCFEDWKRFCAVLREIARGGDDGRPLASFEAQSRAQAILTECGYTWPSVTGKGRDKAPESPDQVVASADMVNGKPLQSAPVKPTRARTNGRVDRRP